MFLKNCWYIAAEAGEVGASPLGRVLLNEPVVFYRKGDGTPVGLEDRCCHRRAPLHKGTVAGDNLRCGYHGFLYDAGGACVEVPGQSLIPPGARVRSYPVRESHGWIWIWMGDRQCADEETVPDLHQNHDSGWAAARGYLRVEADYLLMVDNLLDLSHVAFVHSKTIGSAGDLNPELHSERMGDRLRLTRTVTGIPTTPILAKQGVTADCDQTKVITFTPPTTITITVTTTVAGARPGLEETVPAHRIVILNSMTPETAKTCHYFWTSARDFAVLDEQLTAFFKRETAIAFDEDKEIIEAQQRCIDLDPSAPVVDVRGDVGGLQARKIVERLTAQEAETLIAAAQ